MKKQYACSSEGLTRLLVGALRLRGVSEIAHLDTVNPGMSIQRCDRGGSSTKMDVWMMPAIENTKVENVAKLFLARQLDVEFKVCLGSARRDTTSKFTMTVAEVC